MFKRGLVNSDRVIAVSESTRKDILKEFKINQKKIDVVYPGGDEFYRVVDDEQSKGTVRKKYGLNKEFLLYVSLISPRKNVVRLIRAFKKCRIERKIDVQLVLAGGRGWLCGEVFELVKELGLENDVIFTGYVENNELRLLYNMAKAFIYPSLYEGFGLPVIEAMRCDCPVMASNISSLPEVCDNAAVFFNPCDIDDMSDKINEIVSNDELRRQLILMGRKRAEYFNWEKAARETMTVYKQFS
jgi:glycosyltransferase involved in cell wall biosynthesis